MVHRKAAFTTLQTQQSFSQTPEYNLYKLVLCVQGELAMLDVMLFIERETAFVKGKRQKTASVVEVKHDVADMQVDDHLKSPPGQSPQLQVFVKDGHFDFAAVELDGGNIECQAADVVQAMLLLLATYFAFDLVYPKPYSQILAF